MTQDPTELARDDDPDAEPTSYAGAASRQAAEAGGKEQAEGDEPATEERDDRRQPLDAEEPEESSGPGSTTRTPPASP